MQPLAALAQLEQGAFNLFAHCWRFSGYFELSSARFWQWLAVDLPIEEA